MPKRPSPLSKASSKMSSKKKSASKSWLVKGRDNINERKKASEEVNGRRAPEFWLTNGESAIIRIPMKASEVEASVDRHNFPAKSKSGKRYFRSFTCTGDEDCEGCKAGSKTSTRWPLIVIDHRKMDYTENGKKVNRSKVPKLWLPSINELDKLMAVLEDYQEDRGKPLALSKALLRVRRTGEKAQTSYMFTIKKSGSPMDAAEEKALEEFTETYGALEDIIAPISTKAQKAIVGNADDDEDDDDDDERPRKKSRRREEDEDEDDDEDDEEDDEEVDDDDDEDEAPRRKKKRSRRDEDDDEDEDEVDVDELDDDDEDEDDD